MPDKLLKRRSIRRFLKSARWVLGLVYASAAKREAFCSDAWPSSAGPATIRRLLAGKTRSNVVRLRTVSRLINLAAVHHGAPFRGPLQLPSEQQRTTTRNTFFCQRIQYVIG
jgi:hypothetical protein